MPALIDGIGPKASAPRVTQKDVARVAGVHVTTVSLALRGHHGIPAGTRDRIVAIAERLGYQRDSAFMALTSRRANAHVARRVQRMAFLTNHPGRGSLEEVPHMRYFFEGVKGQAELMGYACEPLFVGGANLSSSALEAHLRVQQCGGLVIGAFCIPGETVTLDWSRYAVVKIDSHFMAPTATIVSNDQMQAVRLACQRLRCLGYRRIGMAVGRYDEDATHDLYTAGYLIEQASQPDSTRIPPLHFDYADQVQDAIPKLQRWVREHRVRVVISNWSEILPMAIATNLRVPDELACVCLSLSDPESGLAGVIQNHRAVGRRAAELVGMALRMGQRGATRDPNSVYIEGQWKDGPTAPPIL